MTADLTKAQEYRRELEDALATLREAGDIGQFVNTPPTGHGNSAKLSSVAQAMLFLAVHLYRVAMNSSNERFEAAIKGKPTTETRREQLRAVHKEVDDLALTMASPLDHAARARAAYEPHEYSPDFEGAIKKGSGL